jgi:hypothetical protein
MYRQTLIATLGASWLALVRRCALMVQKRRCDGYAKGGSGAMRRLHGYLTETCAVQLLPKEDSRRLCSRMVGYSFNILTAKALQTMSP